jgi:mannan endo-1,4-beta-mannosidase
VPLVIDAANWGRNEDYLLNGAAPLLQADPEKNLVFSWHIWDSGIADQRISSAIDKSIQKNFMLLIGEFAPMEVKCNCCIPYHFIMEYSQQKSIGWLSWSWGPGNSDCPAMDMTRTDAFDSLYGWGKEVALTHPFSIKNTSLRPLSLFR